MSLCPLIFCEGFENIWDFFEKNKKLYGIKKSGGFRALFFFLQKGRYPVTPVVQEFQNFGGSFGTTIVCDLG